MFGSVNRQRSVKGRSTRVADADPDLAGAAWGEAEGTSRELAGITDQRALCLHGSPGIRREGGAEMSHRVFIVVIMAAVLLATVAAPAMGAASNLDDAAPVQTETWSQFTDSPDAWLVRVKPRGGCQSGGGGGCTV